MGVERLRTVEYTLMMGPSVERPVLVFLRGQDLAFLAWYKLLNNISPNFPKNQPLVFCMRGGGRWADFNPRSPRGERRSPSVYPAGWKISIHAPRGGSDSIR